MSDDFKELNCGDCFARQKNTPGSGRGGGVAAHAKLLIAALVSLKNREGRPAVATGWRVRRLCNTWVDGEITIPGIL